MAFLQDWRNAKRVFEAATGKKKPSEKALVFFNKSSGLEKALEKLDAALAKKAPKEVATTLDVYRKTFEAYYAIMLKASKDEAAAAKDKDKAKEKAKKDAAETYQKEVLKLNLALNTILREAEEAERALATLMPVEQAVGERALAALRESELLDNPDLKGWLASGDGEMIKIGLQAIPDPESKRCQGRARKAHDGAKQQFAIFNALKPKVMERDKGRAAAGKFIENVKESITSIQEAIGFWFHAQEEAFKENEPVDAPKGRAKEDYDEWKEKSAAWKHVLKLQPLWIKEVSVINAFRAGLK
jgi:hypothetical protein